MAAIVKTRPAAPVYANQAVVVALIDLACVVTATGIAIEEEDEVNIWHFDENGKVARFCYKLDSHQHWAAHEGIDLPGLLGSSRYEKLDDPDVLVEIADWVSAEAREAHMKDAAAAGT